MALLVCITSAPVVASASVLMIDFGPTVPTGSNLTNSPYHSVNSSFTDSYWNVVGNTNVPSGLRYSDNSLATGISLTLGASLNSTLLNFSQLPANSSALGTAVGIDGAGSVFAGNSVGKDGIFTSAPLGNNLVGIKVGGLAAGRYEIYAIGANTSNGMGAQSPSAFFAAAAGDVSSFETNGLTPSAQTLLTSAGLLSWTEGTSYAKMIIDIAEGQYLILAVDGLGPDAGGSENRGFLNAVQIVAVPEPSTIAFCLIGLFALPLLIRKAGVPA